MEEPKIAEGRYLGCEHHFYERPTPPFRKSLFLNEADLKKQADLPAPPKTVKVVEYDQSDFLKSCVERYQQLAGPTGKKTSFIETPFLDETQPIEENEPKGVLAPIASKVLMKVLYAAHGSIRPTKGYQFSCQKGDQVVNYL